MAEAHQTTDPRNTGHGHVFPRPDGVRMRCGGPKFCKECERDQEIKDQRELAGATAAYTLSQIMELLPLTESQKQTMSGEELVKWFRERFSSPHGAPAERTCQWSQTDDWSGQYNTCVPGEEWNLPEGLELFPYCHHCGGKIVVVDDNDEPPECKYCGKAFYGDGDACSTCKPSPEPSAEPDTVGLVAMLRQMQCEPASFSVYAVASAAERAANAIERLRPSREPPDALMRYAVAAGDAIVAGVPQWRDGWAIISRVQTDPPNENWMLHDADEREKESRAEAAQLALVNPGMDFAVVPIKWRTPTKEEKHG